MFDVQPDIAPVPAGTAVPLFRLLADAGRLKILALVQHEDFTISELSFLLEESQPQISKKTAALKKAGLLKTQKEGTRVYQRSIWGSGQITPHPVLQTALQEGERLLEEAGVFARIHKVMESREAGAQAFFEQAALAQPQTMPQANLAGQHLLSALLPSRRFALDVGCGDGGLLPILAPLFEQVLAVEKSPAQMAQTQNRIEAMNLWNVRTCTERFESEEVMRQADLKGGADLVVSARVLRHQASPQKAVQQMARLLARGGILLLADYLPHNDHALQQRRGDVWLGFEASHLKGLVAEAGLTLLNHFNLAPRYFRERHDAHLPMQILTAMKPKGENHGPPN